jgi:hypothetical protein
MAYVRKKRVGKYEYYQLVEGRRIDGKVRQRVIAHLGKHPSLEAARAYAEKSVVPNGEPKEEKPKYVEKLQKLHETWAKGHRGLSRAHNSTERSRLLSELERLKKDKKRSKEYAAAQAEFEVFYERVAAECRPHSEKIRSSQDRAAKLYDSLSPQQQERARDIGIVSSLVSNREFRGEFSRRMAGLL